MDLHEKAKSNADWSRDFRDSIHPRIERVFTVVEWIAVVGFVRFLQEEHGGIVLGAAYVLLQTLLTVYMTATAVALTPLALLGERTISGRAKTVTRLLSYLVAFIVISAALHYAMSVMISQITLSEGR